MLHSIRTNRGKQHHRESKRMWHTLLLLCLCLLSVIGSRVTDISEKMKRRAMDDAARALGYTSLTVLGDSILDTGNNNYIPTIARANFPPYGIDFPNHVPTGRFCDGKIAIDFLAQSFGIKDTVPAYLDPALDVGDLVTGVSFASASSGYDNLTNLIFNSITPSRQLEYLREYRMGLESEIGVDNTTLLFKKTIFVVTFGSNDFIISYFGIPTTRLLSNAHQYTDSLMRYARAFFHELMELGANNVIVVNIPPLGCLPLRRFFNKVQSGECIQDENNVSMEYNRQFKSMIDTESKRLSAGQQMIYVDIYDKFLDIYQNPRAYGMDISEKGCCGSGAWEAGPFCSGSVNVCRHPSKYVFWDSVHPSENTYKILAYHALAQILEHLGRPPV